MVIKTIGELNAAAKDLQVIKDIEQVLSYESTLFIHVKEYSRPLDVSDDNIRKALRMIVDDLKVKFEKKHGIML